MDENIALFAQYSVNTGIQASTPSLRLMRKFA